MKNTHVLSQSSGETNLDIETLTLTLTLTLTGDFSEDIIKFELYCEYTEQIKCALIGRLTEQNKLVHKLKMQAMKSFMRLHGDTLYNKLTNDLELNLNLNQLLDKLKSYFPKILAITDKLATNISMQCMQEYDESVSIFFWGILRIKQSGIHLVETMLLPTPRAVELLRQFEIDGQITFDTLTINIEGDGAIINFCNKDSLNAEDNNLIKDMETAVDLVYLNKKVKVGVLRGGVVNNIKYAGRRVFSAGINLKDLHEGKISFVDFLLSREFGYIHKMIRGVRQQDELSSEFFNYIEKPWVSVVDTFAIGGGMQLLLASDFVIGERDCYASLPAAKEGIVPGAANLRLGHLTNERLAKQVILHGVQIRANSEEGKYIFDRVVEPAQLDSAISDTIEKLAVPAVKVNKRMLLLSRESMDTFREYMAEFVLLQCERLFSEDVQNKTGRFANKSL